MLNGRITLYSVQNLVGLKACFDVQNNAGQLVGHHSTFDLLVSQFVEPSLKLRNKNYFNDAAVVAKAITTLSMVFVPIESRSQFDLPLPHQATQIGYIFFQKYIPWVSI